MATIPTGRGRRVMPGGANPMGRGVPDGSMETGRALQQLGQVAADASFDMMAQQTRLQQEEVRKQQALAEAAARQKDMLELQRAEDLLRDAHDEVANGIQQGTVPKDQAENAWTERAKKLTDEVLPNVRPQSQELARRQLETLGMRLGNSVRKVREKQDRADVSSGIAQSLEYLQRQYSTDPVAAERQAMATIQQLGPFSDYTPQQLTKLAQGWKEQTQFTAVSSAILRGDGSRKGLDEAEKLLEQMGDIDPQKAITLRRQISAGRAAIDADELRRAQRAQIEYERRAKLADSTLQTFQAMWDKGTVIAPEYIKRAMRDTAGFPQQEAIAAMAQQAKETGGIAAQPVNVQRSLLTAIDAEIAQKGRTPELDKRRAQVEKVLQGSEQDLQRDPLRAGLERGVITDLPPLNLGGGVSGLVQQMTERVTQAERVSTWAGRPVAPLTMQEAQGLLAMLNSMPAEQRATAIQTLSTVIPPQQGQALAAQLDNQDRATAIEFALGMARTTFGRPTAELVRKGAEALKAKTIKEEKTPVDGWMGRINTQMASVYANPKQAEMAADAARYILAGMVSEGASGSESDVRRAVRLAVGGTLEDRNGARIVLPAGVERSALDERLKNYPAPELQAQLPDGKVYVRGQAMELQQFLAGLPAAQLRTVGRGRYAVLGGGAIATNSQMQPIVIEVPNAR